MDLQDLLDKDAQLSNSGVERSHPFRKIVREEIVMRRGSNKPICHGEDDCSTNLLMRCPWRIDCGE